VSAISAAGAAVRAPVVSAVAAAGAAGRAPAVSAIAAAGAAGRAAAVRAVAAAAVSVARRINLFQWNTGHGGPRPATQRAISSPATIAERSPVWYQAFDLKHKAVFCKPPQPLVTGSIRLSLP
jgi:hypothetical protein